MQLQMGNVREPIFFKHNDNEALGLMVSSPLSFLFRTSEGGQGTAPILKCLLDIEICFVEDS